jgi:hypothetical protein
MRDELKRIQEETATAFFRALPRNFIGDTEENSEIRTWHLRNACTVALANVLTDAV